MQARSCIILPIFTMRAGVEHGLLILWSSEVRLSVDLHPSRFSWSPSLSLARVAHAFLLPFPLPICRLRGPFLETPLSPIVLLLFVYLSLVISPLPVRVPLRGLWVHVHARVGKVIRRRWIDITPSDRTQYPEAQTV